MPFESIMVVIIGVILQELSRFITSACVMKLRMIRMELT